jgi:hypothetical protein
MLQICDMGQTSLPKEGMPRIFSTWSEPAILGTTRPPKPLGNSGTVLYDVMS